MEEFGFYWCGEENTKQSNIDLQRVKKFESGGREKGKITTSMQGGEDIGRDDLKSYKYIIGYLKLDD